jgi:hypothetical protein
MSDSTGGGRLRDRTWRRFLRGPDPMLLDELYVPALAVAVRYDRSCAYFSSSVLSTAARGFGRFIGHLVTLGEAAPRPAVRLLVNEQMEPADVAALTEAGDTSALEALLLGRLTVPTDVLERQRLALLGWMAKTGLLEVRVGVMRHTRGIVHAKFGIMYDATGDAVVFGGSGNETGSGVAGNYEQLEVTGSWGDPDRLAHYSAEFESLWADRHDDVTTVTLPEAVRLKLIQFAPEAPPTDEPTNAVARQRAYMTWRFIKEACYLPNGAAACDATAMVDLWPHQRRVVEETAAAWPAGRLLCDEVGMGKTVEAVVILRRLLAGRGVGRVLLLLPAGLLKQWQAELREKGGLIFPRLEGQGQLVWPDDRVERVVSLAEALRQPLLLMSRETARTEQNVATVLAADPWDLVLMDEAHAARRAKQVETEFNTANLVLDMLRQLQLRRRARSILLLSATPMQTHPWEPWDLLQVLGEGDHWLADFGTVRDFYGAIGKLRGGQCDLPTAERAAAAVVADPSFPPLPEAGPPGSVEDLAKRLAFGKASSRPALGGWLRAGSPLARRMHRNTRATLRRYHEMGLLQKPPARRTVRDERFDYKDHAERAVYDAVTRYIDRRFRELEGERPGKGFVMTIYRRRASSSPRALQRSLERRRQGLRQVVDRRAHDTALAGDEVPEWLSSDDVPDGDVTVSLALPQDPAAANRELTDLDRLLSQLATLGHTDTKRDRFFDELKQLTDDGRPALVFTEYADTLDYLRDALVNHYQSRLGCYSGDGGSVYDGSNWRTVGKDVITRMLRDGQLGILLCTDAASEGLNLQSAGALVNYDLPWNPSRVEQRIGRIDRIGQTWSDMVVVNLFLQDSIDDRVYGVLRTRCRLFEHFVGAMQPVLDRARQMLRAGEPVDTTALTDAALAVGHDGLVQETYVDAEASDVPAEAPPLDRQDVVAALRLLDGQFGPRAQPTADPSLLLLSGAGTKHLVIACAAEGLSTDTGAVPAVPEQAFVDTILASLTRPGERLPLVIGSAQSGRFRASIAVWVGSGGASDPLQSMDQLRSRLSTWTGHYVAPDAWRRAEQLATIAARSSVEGKVAEAQRVEETAIGRQVGAARIRLLTQLGRYLVCADPGNDDLNETLHHFMSRDMNSAARLRKAFDLLGATYPEWGETLVSDLVKWQTGATAGTIKSLLTGTDLDAAMRDPRWMALPAKSVAE